MCTDRIWHRHAAVTQLLVAPISHGSTTLHILITDLQKRKQKFHDCKETKSWAICCVHLVIALKTFIKLYEFLTLNINYIGVIYWNLLSAKTKLNYHALHCVYKALTNDLYKDVYEDRIFSDEQIYIELCST